MRFSEFTTPLVSPVMAPHPLCEERKYLLMPLRNKGLSHKAPNSSLSSRHLGHTKEAYPISSSTLGLSCTLPFEILKFSSGSFKSNHARWASGWDEWWQVRVSFLSTPWHMECCSGPTDHRLLYFIGAATIRQSLWTIGFNVLPGRNHPLR